NGMDAYLIRDIDLRPYQSAELSYWLDYWIKAGDQLLVQYYAGGNWSTLESYTNSIDTTWNTEPIPINAGKIGFRFISNDDDDVAWGAYIDNVQITAIIPNDAINQSIDAGNDFNNATAISVSSGWTNYPGYLDPEYQNDIQDWYKFYVASGKTILVQLSSPPGANFDVEIYNPYNEKKAGPGDYISRTTDATGYWRIKVYIASGFGQYSFNIKMYTSVGGPGGCPILSVYNGTGYVEEGLLDIHNPDEEDMVTSHVLIHTPEPLEHRYLLRLTEHPQTYSHLDQVQLFAMLTNGTKVKLPLTSAIHSEDGNVKQELLLSDDVRAVMLGENWNNGTSQYIDLEFVAPDGLVIETFTFIIEGHNWPLKIP
ncbi:MAG: hypothetical protein OEX09_09420, partial [Candidatus Bathyarchaeota archaeon]|nr:hypothetical protein [Candidatus Bathyarchaeota archaeon]